MSFHSKIEPDGPIQTVELLEGETYSPLGKIVLIATTFGLLLDWILGGRISRLGGGSAEPTKTNIDIDTFR